jgi:hypothetical protein
MVRIADRGDFDKIIDFYKSYANARDLDNLKHEVFINTAAQIEGKKWNQQRGRAAEYVQKIFERIRGTP